MVISVQDRRKGLLFALIDTNGMLSRLGEAPWTSHFGFHVRRIVACVLPPHAAKNLVLLVAVLFGRFSSHLDPAFGIPVVRSRA